MMSDLCETHLLTFLTFLRLILRSLSAQRNTATLQYLKGQQSRIDFPKGSFSLRLLFHSDVKSLYMNVFIDTDPNEPQSEAKEESQKAKTEKKVASTNPSLTVAETLPGWY